MLSEKNVTFIFYCIHLMKITFTPIDQLESFIQSEDGKEKLERLKPFYTELNKKFQVLRDLPVKLTEEAIKQYLDIGELDTELHRFLLTSGLLPSYPWEEWMEGREILDGIRKVSKLAPMKALKLLFLIIKLDGEEKGRFEKSIKNGQILWLLECLFNKLNELKGNHQMEK